jgi:hypothetical protein
MSKEKEGERLRQKQLVALQQKIDRGLAQLQRGEGISGDEARDHFAHKRKAQKQTPGS